MTNLTSSPIDQVCLLGAGSPSDKECLHFPYQQPNPVTGGQLATSPQQDFGRHPSSPDRSRKDEKFASTKRPRRA